MTSLPRLMVVADLATVGVRLPEIVGTAVDHGARAVVLRAREAPTATRVEIAGRLRQLLSACGWSGDRRRNSRCRASICRPSRSFPIRDRPLWADRATRADEVDRAVAEGCDYAFVSPVYPSASKPGYGPALGPQGLAALCRPGLPIYALGGVLPERVAECVHAGAYGVAVMGPVLRDPTVVTAYLAALSEVAT